jgi:adenylate kinase
MGIVLIAGIADSSKDAMMTVFSEDKMMPDFKQIKFHFADHFLKDMFGYIQEFNKSLESDIIANIKTQSHNIIINVPLTIDTETGYVPVMQETFFDLVKPDVLILVEDKPSIRMNREERKTLELHQDVNREYAAQYSAQTGCALKIVEVDSGYLKDAIKEVKGIIKKVMV